MEASKSFLIIQLYSNGDCLYATTIARQLKWDHPGCQVTWAVAPFCKSILRNNSFVDTIWEVEYMSDRKIGTFRKNKQRLFDEAGQKKFDEIFFTQIIEDNFQFYDGMVRSSIFSAFQHPISMPAEPVLELTETELKKVEEFVANHKIRSREFVILFESSPQSGQLSMDTPRAYELAKKIIQQDPGTAIILSSQNKISTDNELIIDGSELSLRETAALTHYCHLLIGCSSGITWVSTSSAGKAIPSIQLLNKKAYIFNSPVLDHKRNGLDISRWLELYQFDNESILSCISTMRKQGFDAAKKEFGQASIQTFRVYRGVVHQFLQQFKFGLLRKFIRHNYRLYGFNWKMMKSIFLGIILFPAQLVVNLFRKK